MTSSDGYQGRFLAAAEEVARLLSRKRRDYGWQNIADSGTEGVVLRLQDKLNRLRTLGANGKPNNESTEDTWLDVVGYGIIGLLVLRKKWIQPQDDDVDNQLPLPLPDQPTPVWSGDFPRLVYLGGPIDCTTPDRANGWRTKATEYLNRNGVATYNPVAAFNWAGGTQMAHLLGDINAGALQRSSAAIFHLPSDTLTVGSIIEIQMAIHWKVPTVVWGDEKVAGNLYLAMLEVPVEPTLESVIERLVASTSAVTE